MKFHKSLALLKSLPSLIKFLPVYFFWLSRKDLKVFFKGSKRFIELKLISAIKLLILSLRNGIIKVCKSGPIIIKLEQGTLFLTMINTRNNSRRVIWNTWRDEFSISWWKWIKPFLVDQGSVMLFLYKLIMVRSFITPSK